MSSERTDVATLLKNVAVQLAGCQRVLVAYSGGLDSSVLLHMLYQLMQQRSDLVVRAAYVHHGLSAQADRWAQHCMHTCQQWDIPCAVLPVTVDARERGVEAAAREVRYQALRQHLLPDEVLLTAQHLDDQSETFLLALKRGSGPAGLSAMGATGLLGTNPLLRPLLGVARARLDDYAHHYRLAWVEDESNGDARYDRNFLRLQVLPQLKQRWPSFPEAVARSARLCAEQEQLLDELLAASLQLACDTEGALAIDALIPLSEPHRFALLRRWLRAHEVTMPSREQLLHLWQDVALSRQDAEPLLQLGSVQIRRFRQRLYCVAPCANVASLVLPWHPEQGALTLPHRLGFLSLAEQGMRIRRPHPDEQVSVRFGLKGTLHIVGRSGGRSAKKLWQEYAIPPWKREQIPIVYYNQQPIAAVGVFVMREGDTSANDTAWQIVWRMT
ncbi:tRNA lysidine(34) synthetase TilS [Candidatus Symbiopectobacterium sp. NZEC127]|uniref:tRNA lysidine(34) synthetase TilS n=1 Tax=Candidatus Symbiopectobacterium sp. NZEC127 TaxID=2820472 RepID=UPI002226FEC4|nr:tRNA lysidine(34) synthetase TilS [Candidatus Symbiopectobacterium sp. NZEC127]MCW2487387.1 tRNA lysidine(34) synthetase TilS [Candidatus Symbiopectobacterium sp. NZEC127]